MFQAKSGEILLSTSWILAGGFLNYFLGELMKEYLEEILKSLKVFQQKIYGEITRKILEAFFLTNLRINIWKTCAKNDQVSAKKNCFQPCVCLTRIALGWDEMEDSCTSASSSGTCDSGFVQTTTTTNGTGSEWNQKWVRINSTCVVLVIRQGLSLHHCW